MTWPQWIMAVVLLLSVFPPSIKAAKDQRLSSWQATGYVLLAILEQVGVALVLHAGRFW